MWQSSDQGGRGTICGARADGEHPRDGTTGDGNNGRKFGDAGKGGEGSHYLKGDGSRGKEEGQDARGKTADYNKEHEEVESARAKNTRRKTDEDGESCGTGM